jgi:hypothetical protein
VTMATFRAYAWLQDVTVVLKIDRLVSEATAKAAGTGGAERVGDMPDEHALLLLTSRREFRGP